MEILVINLMRLGDLIQAGPVLRGLQAEYPGARVSLLVMDVFREAALLLEGADRLLLFPSSALAAAMNGKGDWPEACRLLCSWLKENLDRIPDLVINLSPIFLGAILSFLTRGKKVRGFAVNRARGAYTSPPWASYAMVVSRARTANPFNLVDLFVREAGLVPDGRGVKVMIPPEAQRQADAGIEALGLKAGTALVGLFPGASRPERQWPAENFTRTASLLRDQLPCHFFIFGSPQEKPLGEAIRSRLPASEVTDCQGQTPLPLLAAYLKRMDLLIANDTGPMHLAAAVGTPVLALFLATARVQDTGPAGRGHVALEPELPCHPCVAPCSFPRCHTAVTPSQVAALGLCLLNRDFGKWRGSSAGLRIYCSEVDPRGYQTYLPLFRPRLDKQAFWTWIHRLAWDRALDAHGPEADAMGLWVKRIISRSYQPPVADLGVAAGRRALAELLDLAFQGEKGARQIVKLAQEKATPARLQQEVEAFAAIDRNLRRLAVEFPEIASLVEFFFQEQRKSTGSEVSVLAQELAQAYGALHKTARIFLEAVQELAALASPVWPKAIQEAAPLKQDPEVFKDPQAYRGWLHAGNDQ